MQFNFATAGQIHFGAGTLAQVGAIAATLGNRALVVTGKSGRHAEHLLELLKQADITYLTYNVDGEPTIAIAQDGTLLAHEESCDLIIGFGGGSALDTGKAISGLLTNGDDPLDFLEVIGRGKPLTRSAAPFIAIPTTAGTGSEVTRNAVLASKDHHVKVSMRSHLLLPRVAIVDPELTISMPPAVTASTGLDALTQVIEPFLSQRANPLIDAICREGIRRAARSLGPAYHDGENMAARTDMALVSLFGGLALANAGLGAVHGFAGPFGGMVSAPHGATCAALLPHVMRVNLRALQDRDPENPALLRFTELGRLLSGHEGASANAGIEILEALCEDLNVPGLAHYGLKEGEISTLVEKATQSSSMKANPIQLTLDEMEEILSRAL